MAPTTCSGQTGARSGPGRIGSAGRPSRCNDCRAAHGRWRTPDAARPRRRRRPRASWLGGVLDRLADWWDGLSPEQKIAIGVGIAALVVLSGGSLALGVSPSALVESLDGPAVERLAGIGAWLAEAVGQGQRVAGRIQASYDGAFSTWFQVNGAVDGQTFSERIPGG